MKLLLVGHGKMGQLVGTLAPQYDGEVAGVIDPMSPLHGGGPDAERWGGVDVAIDFSTPDSVVNERAGAGEAGHQPGGRHHRLVAARGGAAQGGRRRRASGIVVAPNFSTGVVLFEALVAHAARLFAPQQEFAAFLHEAHHSAKKDAPSGTAFLLKRAMEQAGFPRPIDVSLDASRIHPRHAHDRLRRPGGNDHADAHRARSHGVRPRRARRGALGPRQARLVHDAGCAGDHVGRVGGRWVG